MAQQHGKEPPAGRQSSANYETVFTNAKAGMEGVDAEKVKRVIFEASKGSAHYENERRKERAHEERIARMHAARLQLTPADLARHTAAMDAKLAASEAGRDLSRTWLHIDMDAFFAAVEELDRPDLHNRPFAVGGMGMISTANYAARKFGVRSAMPGFLALKLCPDLTFVAPQFGKYRAASERTRAIFRDYDPSLPPLAASLDEASLDVTQHCEQQGVDPDQLAAEIRGRVRRETGLTCSVGIAPNRTLAKICSDANKPDGQFRLPAHRQAVMDFVAALSIRKVPGVGRVTQRLLAALGVHTCADLVTHRGLLQALFSPTACDFFVRVALGLGPTQHTPPPAQGEVGRKGISHERTFRPTSSQEELEGRLGELAAALARDMAGEGLRGRTVTLKLKLSTFELRTRAASVASHMSAAADLYAVGRSLLLPELPCELRLLGLRVSSFLEPARREAGQLSIEQMLQRRQQGAGVQQQQQQQQAAGQPAGGCVPSPSTRHSRGGDAAQECCEEEEAEVEEGAVEEEEEGEEGLHTSQVLSDGEFLELSLKHWEPPASTQDSAQPNPSLQDWCGNDSGGDSGPPAPAGGCQLPASHGGALPAYSLPPSPLVSPAKAAGGGAGAAAEAEACAGEQVEAAAGAPLPRPAGQQVASRRPGSSGGAGEGAERQREAAEAVVPQQQQEQQAQQMWTCAACTFDNPRTAFWCEMCRSSRLPLKASAVPAAAAAPATKGASGTNAGKAKRGRKSGAAGLAAAATAAAPSILRFMSAAAPHQQQQQQQREGSQPQRQQEQQPEPQRQQDQSQQLQQPQPHQPQQPQQPLPAEQAVGSEQAGGPQEESLHQSQAVPVPGAEMQQQWGGEEDDGDGLWGDSDDDDDDDEPGSPLLPGEDVMECNLCWEWVRETRLQAHMDVHKDQELAQKLQAEEDRLARLFGSNPSTSATPATAGGSGSGKKRQAGGKSGGGGGPGKQATLTAVFSKRAKK